MSEDTEVLAQRVYQFRQERIKLKMAHREGLEPPTRGFGDRYSAN